MIPDLPEGMTKSSIIRFYDTIAGNLQDQSTLHMHWFTHTRNPSVCWICDMNILLTKLIDFGDSFITKSTVDIETVSKSENETDSESETMNYDEENEPEYETED